VRMIRGRLITLFLAILIPRWLQRTGLVTRQEAIRKPFDSVNLIRLENF